MELHGESIDLPLPDGPGKALKLTIAPVQERIPIYIAAIGPKNTQLAAEIDVFRQQYHVDLQAQQRARAAKLQEQLRRSGVKVAPTRDGDRTATDRQNERVRDQGGRER